jgi:protein subunit release factor B
MISLRPLAGSKLTKNGVIIITANRHRTQEANRRDALDHLIAMIIEADNALSTASPLDQVAPQRRGVPIAR